MLFNSHLFIFGFLPVTVAGFLVLRKSSPRTARWWLLLASLGFYGYWRPIYLLLIIGSIIFNYVLSRVLSRTRSGTILAFGIAVNLVAIGYFKYATFFVGIAVSPENVPPFLQRIILPLAISFFTFQQIAYLIDVRRGEVAPGDFPTYALFVSFFPQLIAGPIVRYQQIAPQLVALTHTRRRIPLTLLPGVILFVLGLCKKVLVADTFAPYADAVFALPPLYQVGLYDAWIGAYAYTFQLYFDFSGYSDMAIGLALMVGLRIPVNFFSPYQAPSVIEFWRRWHMTLSHFFRDYVYIPLGGNRDSGTRRVVNLLLVMLLVGLWHGAGWTFVLWGIYHGSLLATTHIMRFCRARCSSVVTRIAPQILAYARMSAVRRAGYLGAWLTTFHLVVLGWVLFRSPTVAVAQEVVAGLTFQNGTWSSIALGDERLYAVAVVLILVALVVCTVLPNSIQIIERLHGVAGSGGLRREAASSWQDLRWRLSPVSALALGALAYFAASTISELSTEFLYFNF